MMNVDYVMIMVDLIFKFYQLIIK